MPEDTDDALDPLRVLSQRLGEATEPLGLDLQTFVVNVIGPGQDMVQATFLIDSIEIGRNAEHAAMEAEFRRQLDDYDRQAAQEKHDAEANEAIERAQRLLGRKPHKEE